MYLTVAPKATSTTSAKEASVGGNVLTRRTILSPGNTAEAARLRFVEVRLVPGSTVVFGDPNLTDDANIGAYGAES